MVCRFSNGSRLTCCASAAIAWQNIINTVSSGRRQFRMVEHCFTRINVGETQITEAGVYLYLTNRWWVIFRQLSIDLSPIKPKLSMTSRSWVVNRLVLTKAIFDKRLATFIW